MKNDISNEELISRIQAEVRCTRKEAIELLTEIQPPMEEMKPELPERFWPLLSTMNLWSLIGAVAIAITAYIVGGC